MDKLRHTKTASPQNSMKPTEKVLLDSPKVSISKEVANFTPPHKKLNLDESWDDSPMSEGCYSPTFFSSQTYGSDSPDVIWNWEKDNNASTNQKDNIKTDSGFLSIVNCSSNSDSESRRKRNETQRREYINKRMERKREKDLKIRKAQRAQAESLLKERLTQLESQLKSIRTTTEQTQEEKLPEFGDDQPVQELNIFDDIDNIFEQSNIDFEEPKPTMSESNKHDQMNSVDCFDDFFNDADTDDMLVEATQKLESVMPELTQTVIRTETKFSNTPDMPSTTPNRNKRSSLYMEFLEDDGDDFFVSLDDDWLRKATQPNKTRSPFQRYKSMPTSSSTSSRTSPGTLMGNLKANESSKKTHAYPNENLKKSSSNASSAPYKTNTLRRHASSSMSPSSTHYRGRQQHSRN